MSAFRIGGKSISRNETGPRQSWENCEEGEGREILRLFCGGIIKVILLWRDYIGKKGVSAFAKAVWGRILW